MKKRVTTFFVLFSILGSISKISKADIFEFNLDLLDFRASQLSALQFQDELNTAFTGMASWNPRFIKLFDMVEVGIQLGVAPGFKQKPLESAGETSYYHMASLSLTGFYKINDNFAFELQPGIQYWRLDDGGGMLMGIGGGPQYFFDDSFFGLIDRAFVNYTASLMLGDMIHLAQVGVGVSF